MSFSDRTDEHNIRKNTSETKEVKQVRRQKEFVHVGDYVAEVDIDVIYTDDEWSPYISLEDARRLDEVREALRAGDLKRAVTMARVYKLVPVAA